MKLKQWRTERGLSASDLASKLHFSERAVIKWERGERRPRPDALAAISSLTEGAVTPNDFFDPPATSSESAQS
jgi:transcriptional regulator with XRE-family HTH domain